MVCIKWGLHLTIEQPWTHLLTIHDDDKNSNNNNDNNNELVKRIHQVEVVVVPLVIGALGTLSIERLC